MAESLLSYALVSLEEVKGEACLNISGTTHDDALTLLVNYITELFEAEMGGRRLPSTTYSSLGVGGATAIDALDGDGTGLLFLPQFPVTELTTLQIDGEALDERPSVEDSGWVLYGDEGFVRYDGGTFTKGVQNIDLTYTAGYPTVPADVRAVALMEIKRAWAKVYKNELGKSSEADPQGNRTWITADLLPETKRVLGKYRKRMVA